MNPGERGGTHDRQVGLMGPPRPGQNEALADSGARHTRIPTHHFAPLPKTLQSFPIILRIKSYSSPWTTEPYLLSLPHTVTSLTSFPLFPLMLNLSLIDSFQFFHHFRICVASGSLSKGSALPSVPLPQLFP